MKLSKIAKNRKIGLSAVIFIYSFIHFSTGHAQYEIQIEQSKRIFDQILSENDFPGLSVAIGVDDEIVYADGVGYANVQALERPDRKTIFRYYSISKALAGFLAIKLADDKRLNLDEPIGNILQDLPEHIAVITPRQLLGHISGVRHYRDNGEWNKISLDHCKSPSEALSIFINDPLISNPGEAINYTSFGYVLLSAVLEKVGGASFNSLMKNAIFAPSGVHRIYLDNPKALQPNNTSKFIQLQMVKSNQHAWSIIVANSLRVGILVRQKITQKFGWQP